MRTRLSTYEGVDYIQTSLFTKEMLEIGFRVKGIEHVFNLETRQVTQIFIKFWRKTFLRSESLVLLSWDLARREVTITVGAENLEKRQELFIKVVEIMQNFGIK